MLSRSRPRMPQCVDQLQPAHRPLASSYAEQTSLMVVIRLSPFSRFPAASLNHCLDSERGKQMDYLAGGQDVLFDLSWIRHTLAWHLAAETVPEANPTGPLSPYPNTRHFQ